MAHTTVAAANAVDQWSSKIFKEFVREQRFARYTGMSHNAIFQLVEDLGKKPGDDVTVSLVTRLQNNGVTGDNTLEGNEEALGNYGHKVTVDQLRHAVSMGHMAQATTHIDMLREAKPMLKKWRMEKMRDEFIAALLSPSLANVAYASATEANKDAWLDANTDRILFGAAKSNLKQTAPAGGATNDHSASLSEIDNTSDKLTPALAQLAKRMAQTADAHIRPVTVKETDDEEWYVMFCNPQAFRDLAANSTMTQANRDARVRGEKNPLFRGGDLLYDGIIFREIPEIAALSGVGASSIDVAPNFLCGAQAVALAWKERPHAIKNGPDGSDYGNIKGVGIAEIRGVDKLFYNNKQHGVVTVYTAGVADT